MEQNEYTLDSDFENFENKWKDEELLRKLEEKSLHYAKMSWFLFFGHLLLRQ